MTLSNFAIVNFGPVFENWVTEKVLLASTTIVGSSYSFSASQVVAAASQTIVFAFKNYSVRKNIFAAPTSLQLEAASRISPTTAKQKVN